MLVKVGDQIQLNLQLEDGATDKYPRAYLRDQFGYPLPESPVDLTHIGDGLYSDDSVYMPNTQEVTATFKVFDDLARTILSPFYSIEMDVFAKDQSASLIAALLGQNLPGDIDGLVDDSGALAAFMEDSGAIFGVIDDSGSIYGFIEEWELTGILVDDGELYGQLATC
jgi:hypothetical protein